MASSKTLTKEDMLRFLESDAELRPAAKVEVAETKPRASKATGKSREGGQRITKPSGKWSTLERRQSAAKTADTRKPKSRPKRISEAPSKRGSRASSAFAFGNMKAFNDFSDFSESDDEEDVEDTEERRVKQADLPPEYWAMQKLVRFLSGGNQTATVIALCSLRDFDLTSEMAQFAIRDGGGLDLLINLLETEDDKCKIGALQVLKDISLNVHVKRAIAELNGIRPLVELLSSSNPQITALAGDTIANCAQYPRNRRMVRFYDGITKCVKLLQIGVDQPEKWQVARGAALALWSCSKSEKNKQKILKAGAVPLLAKLLTSDTLELTVPVVGVLAECASSAEYRKLIIQLNLTGYLVENLSKDNRDLQAHSALAIFKCAEDAAVRTVVRESNGIPHLINLLQFTDDILLLEGVTGAIWKCAQDQGNARLFVERKAVESLVALLSCSSEAVLTNVAGALGQLALDPEAGKQLRVSGGIGPLVNLLSGNNADLLINVTRAVGVAARFKENIDTIDKLDGVRLLWSLLKSSNLAVQSSAADAICPCIKNARDAGELVRSFVGGLELVVGLLRSNDLEVLASVSRLIAQIALDEENLAVITDHGVVAMLSKLVRTSNDNLRESLAEAIANCCAWGNNRVDFGKEGAVGPVSRYLKSKSDAVHLQTARALHELSKHPDNCVTMHKSGVVPPLLDLVGSSDPVVQEAAAHCLGNIRRLALANEMSSYN
eukprot:m.357558 g.357558  ORF g.357558 m.357558 type:complete len:722 (-) comp17865_c0_seq1:200-2365(-)